LSQEPVALGVERGLLLLLEDEGLRLTAHEVLQRWRHRLERVVVKAPSLAGTNWRMWRSRSSVRWAKLSAIAGDLGICVCARRARWGRGRQGEMLSASLP
jgi:hypothetical protein